MHELKLAEEVINIVRHEAEKHNAGPVNEIAIEAGIFCGVETEAFKGALNILTEGSILEKARFKIILIKGKGYCNICSLEFEMGKRFDTCPQCNSLPSEIKGGNEFRIVSMSIEEQNDIQVE
jgi:hydrogenase nickel incorporation protein HypA/HybF